MTEDEKIQSALRNAQRLKEELPYLIQPESWIEPFIALAEAYERLRIAGSRCAACRIRKRLRRTIDKRDDISYN